MRAAKGTGPGDETVAEDAEATAAADAGSVGYNDRL